MSFRALVTAAFLLAFEAFAQADGGTPLASAPEAATDVEAVRREFDGRLESARKEIKQLREEMRANSAMQSVASGWSDEWVAEKRKLEFFEPDGYFRIRPDLFNKFDMARLPDPSGFYVFPKSPWSPVDDTNAGVNMRFRFEPTFNVSESVRLRMQIDALDNVLFGSNPDYAFSRNGGFNYGYDRDQFSIFSSTQVPPRSGVNSFQDSIAFKRVWGEVQTPVGILRFGRMGSQWGLGMQHNDGNCIDCDYGDTVDRLMFTAEPISTLYISPMFDFNTEGPFSQPQQGGGQPFDLNQLDDGYSLILAIAKRDTESQRQAKLDNGQTVWNLGLHFTYKTQRIDAAGFYASPWTNDGQAGGLQGLSDGYTPRQALMFIPDLWVKVEQKIWRIEAELVGQFGSIGNSAFSRADANDVTRNQTLYIQNFGGVVQGEVRLLNESLTIGAEVGFASGDRAPGFGNFPRRTANRTKDGGAGNIDGAQWNCTATPCSDAYISNYRFNRDYRVDMILFRELLGGVTDAIYIKPKVNYRIADGLNVFGSVIYSRALFAESTPSARFVNGQLLADANLGVEINVGARWETNDGFFAQFMYGILFPLGGFGQDLSGLGNSTPLSNPQALRALLGVKF